MKYTHKVKLKDGSYIYRFVPPKDAKLAGVMKNHTFKDGRQARYEIPKLLKTVEEFRIYLLEILVLILTLTKSFYII